MDARLNNFRRAYGLLADRARISLAAQVQNRQVLLSLRSDVLRFIAAAEPVRRRTAFPPDQNDVNLFQHADVFSVEEYNTLRQNIDIIVALIDDALFITRDTPDDIDLVVAWFNVTHQPGRPRFEVDPNFLALAVQTRGCTSIAGVLGCSARTVRRRVLEHGLAPGGQSPFLDIEQPDGDVRQVWNGPIRHTNLSEITDEALDGVIAEILLISPEYGRRMIDGALKSRGIYVAPRRLAASYRRVHGPPAGFFDRRIARRAYTVPGVNSVWHHDGQHGTISRNKDVLFAHILLNDRSY